MLLAKDVIAQIKAKRFVPVSGTWADVFNADDAKDAPFQAHFLAAPATEETEQPYCECCAVGSLFLSCTLFANKMSNAEIDESGWLLGTKLHDKHKFGNGFHKVFSLPQLALIEVAFEGETTLLGTPCSLDATERRKAIAFETSTAYARACLFRDKNSGPLGRNDDQLLLAIMQNIVKNNGTFKP